MLVWFCLTLAAQVDAKETLREADEAMASTYFEKAIPLYRAVLYPPQLKGQELLAARVSLARSYYYTSQLEAARVELRLLFNKRLDYKPTKGAPDFDAFFELVRSEQKPAATPRAPSPKPPPVQPQPQPQTVTVIVAPASQPAATSPVETVSKPEGPRYTPAHPGVRWLPFGIGQFLNGDPVGGAIFLSLSIASGAANLGLALHVMRVKVGEDYPRRPEFPAVYYAQIATAGAFYAVLVVSVIDALLWSPSRAKARLALAPLNGGGVLALAGSF